MLVTTIKGFTYNAFTTGIVHVMVGFTIIGKCPNAIFLVPKDLTALVVFGALPACGISIGIIGINIFSNLTWCMRLITFILVIQVVSLAETFNWMRLSLLLRA
jgi:hypothetical protein